MNETDFSRIGETYSKEISTKRRSTELKSIILHAMDEYGRNRLKYGNHKPLLYTYSYGMDKVSLMLSSMHGLPSLKSLTIKSETKDVMSLIPLLRGQIQADYNDLETKLIPPTIKTRKIDNMCSYSETLSFMFGRKGEELVLKKAVRQMFNGREFVNINIEDRIMSEDEMKLFLMADRIKVDNYFYPGNDKNNQLMKENCTIISGGSNEYGVTYDYSSISDSSLYYGIFPMVKTIFRLLTKKFSDSIYSTYSTKEMLESQYE